MKIETAVAASSVKRLARQALDSNSASETVQQHARSALYRPIVYMRCAEFYAVLKCLDLKPGMHILDISSPQWFSLLLAEEYPQVHFTYVNILESETEPFKDICQTLRMKNLAYVNGDVRALSFGELMFDKVVSISVLEHVYPESGGDFHAFKEIRRVLKDDGELHLTLPYKDKSNIVYVDGPVYERDSQEKNFFAREYDRETFEFLVRESDFCVKSAHYIMEKRGILSLDYHEWGPGKGSRYARFVLKLKEMIEMFLRRDVEEVLARHYLLVSPQITERLVNIAAVLGKKS